MVTYLHLPWFRVTSLVQPRMFAQKRISGYIQDDLWKYIHTLWFNLWAVFIPSIHVLMELCVYTQDVTLHCGKSGRRYGPRSCNQGDHQLPFVTRIHDCIYRSSHRHHPRLCTEGSNQFHFPHPSPISPVHTTFLLTLPLARTPPLYLLTCAHKVSALSIAEVMEDLVSVGLCHAGVDEETGVPQLCDLLCQQLHSLH